MNRIKDSKGIARTVALFALIALVLITIIAIRIVRIKAEETKRNMDDTIVVSAEREALINYLQDDSLTDTVAIFDIDTKKFIEPAQAKLTIEPYGNSKENLGKYLQIKFGKDHSISSKWVAP
ncbi:hypothetical protein [Butyrivibrio sp. INlla16]|uniref:hypothetical protein n=1 Tax=Butyrivibrio sp. INlla16 TaxID=1520807 RepID=UPI0008845683|nr:hypothetical protein [Butyrivibrio sp. INlla16]SDB15102.1 hypothetical protein SAMN02910263_00728 [Butyrivibrio sp. INlla16]